MAFHGSCHKKKICTEEGITNKNSGILFFNLSLKQNIMRKKKQSEITEFLENYTIKGRETETNEKVIPLESVPKLIEVIKQELLTKINESWKDLN